MKTFDDFILESLIEEAVELTSKEITEEEYLEAIGDWANKAANWLGNKATAAGNYLSQKARDPNSMLNPQGAQTTIQGAQQKVQQFGQKAGQVAQDFSKNPAQVVGKGMQKFGQYLQNKGQQTGDGAPDPVISNIKNTERTLEQLHKTISDLQQANYGEIGKQLNPIKALIAQAMQKTRQFQTQ